MVGKLFRKECAIILMKILIYCKIGRYHNIYGPMGISDEAEKKAPAALCRKIAKAKLKK